MDIKWEVPPSPIRGPREGRPEEVEFAQALVQNPDRWARFKDYETKRKHTASSLAATIRRSQRAAFRLPADVPGRFDVVVRRDREDPNVTAVYVRYVTTFDS